MYVTRPLSQLLKSPESLAAPPEGPNSGYLVIQDEESETYSCFGCCKNLNLSELPFPQNKELMVRYVYAQSTPVTVDDSLFLKQRAHVTLDSLFLIPVLNQPLSSNRYYAIVPHGKHKGEAYTCSREEDKATCCFYRYVRDAKPRPLELDNIYHQFEIVPWQALCSNKGDFVANSIASDGFPPYFLRRNGWTICGKTPDGFPLESALGLDSRLRARLPEFGSSVPCVVGKWYSPFIFVKEGALKDQVKRSVYYEVTLEQRWEQIFSCRKNGNSVVIDASVEIEEAFIGGNKATWNEKGVVDGVIWFTVHEGGGERAGVGLRTEIVERMKWEQKRGGFEGGEERVVKVNRVEEIKGSEEWSEFGCYVLVERFNFKRMDGSLVMSYDFKHLHQIKTKWE